MSGKATHNLSKERIQQLLTAIGSKPVEDTGSEKVTEYNWFEPHSLDRQQLDQLDGFVNQLATAMAAKFSDFCRTRYEVTVASTTFHFASEFLTQASENKSKNFSL